MEDIGSRTIKAARKWYRLDIHMGGEQLRSERRKMFLYIAESARPAE